VCGVITISLCMIVRDAERTIARCLDSVKDAVDEIVVVDTGSADRTREIVRRYTDRIYDFAWIDDFAAARNHSFSLATQGYILWLDADDYLAEEDRDKLIELKKTLDPRIDAVCMLYYLSFDARGLPVMAIRRNRLVKRSRNFRWHDPVHEYLAVGGNILFSDIAVRHGREEPHTERNLGIYERRMARGETLSHRDLFYYANELTELKRYEQAIETYLRFFAEPVDNVEDNLAACDKIAHCFRELGDREKELMYLLKSFEYDVPRADFCCRIGYHFQETGKYRHAIFWYETALKLGKPEHCMGAVNLSCWTYLPHVLLCICYGKVGEMQKAYEHNEIVRSYFPDDPNVLDNKRKLEEILGRAKPS
jgi:glycosyltransferase involved in cell wall biosynthesis